MPSKTKKQAKFMAAVANSPKFAKKAGVPQSVGKEFAKADKGKTFQEGGMASRAHDKKVIRNLDDEDYRIRNRTGKNTDAERRRINREKDFEKNKIEKTEEAVNEKLEELVLSSMKSSFLQEIKNNMINYTIYVLLFMLLLKH